jgi:putative transposase
VVTCPTPVDPSSDTEKLYIGIGRFKVPLDWLKKSRVLPVKLRKIWISSENSLPVSMHCQLVDVNRTNRYGKPKQLSPNDDDLLLRLIDEEYTLHPFYGSRRMRQVLIKKGSTVNRKWVQRLMRSLGLAGMATSTDTRKSHSEHKVYPYLLRGVTVTGLNQVGSVVGFRADSCI